MTAYTGRDSSAIAQRRFTRAGASPGKLPERSALVERAVAGAKAGDMDALHFLYLRYADSVRGYVNSIVHDTYEAEDITQNVFTGLLGKMKRYESREVPFAAWLLRVARNAALDHLRSRRAVPVEEVRASDDRLEDIASDRQRSLTDALERLPYDQREVLVLRHVVGLSPGEIASRLAKSESSVHGLHHRGRAALKVALRELDAGPVTATG